MRRWTAPAVFLAIAMVAGWLAVQSATAQSPTPSRAEGLELATPVLSARRVPELVTQTLADGRLRAGLDLAFAAPALEKSKTCLVVEVGPRRLYEREAALPLIPASTLKVLTGVAALEKLGRDGRYATEARLDPQGRLWLVGSGDPLLATPDYAATAREQPQLFTNLDNLASDIVDTAGIRSIPGGVWGDESRYDSQRYLSSWPATHASTNQTGPLSALTVNDGFATYGARLVAAPVPAHNAAEVLANLLRAKGAVVGSSGTGVTPAEATTVAAVASPTVTDIVGQMLRASENMTAELLVKEMGKRFGTGGTWAAGTEVVRTALAETGFAGEGMVVTDGSGLDRSGRLSCGLLSAALDRIEPSGPIAAGLPVAGRSGTLAGRFVGTPATGRLRAKTGSLNFVSGLVGFVDTSAGAIEFSLLANDLPDPAARGRLLQDQVGAVLAAYPNAPAAADLAPLPPAPPALPVRSG